MARYKTFLPGATLTHTDLNNIQSDYEHLFTSWRNLQSFNGNNFTDSLGAYVLNTASTYMLGTSSRSSLDSFGSTPSEGFTTNRVFYINPTNYTSLKKPNLHVRFTGKLFVNSTAPVSTFTFNLYTAPTWSPRTIGAAYTISNASIYAGASVAITTPTAGSENTFTSGTVTLNTAGLYTVAMKPSANTTANSVISILSYLQYSRS